MFVPDGTGPTKSHDDDVIGERHARDVLARLRDERRRRVIFVSHCLLNENTRYAGGAFQPGAVAPLVSEITRRGWGIYQMPCPEQRAWGGVLKRYLVAAYGRKPGWIYRLRRPALRAFTGYTRRVYDRLARRVVRDIADYERAGFEVVAIVGVGASPSCGVRTTLDMGRSLEVVASCPLALLDRDVMNTRAVAGCQIAGEGLFTSALKRRLERNACTVPFLEHDLVAEMRGIDQAVLDQLDSLS